MFGSRKPNALEPPDLATERESREILRVWVRPGWSKMSVALLPDSRDPSLWGIALVDIARHVAKAYALDGVASENDALARIKQVFDAEWGAPTEMPEGRLRE